MVLLSYRQTITVIPIGESNVFLDMVLTDLIKGRQKFALTPEMENLISQNTPISQRTKAIKELSDAVLSNQFEHVSNY